ncbi:unnamed protein product [Amoebophrya sp. A120]|nr:unnamed protein product [Amoebophrya sp. A120]|eukprot:GSA120T00005547001.1
MSIIPSGAASESAPATQAVSSRDCAVVAPLESGKRDETSIPAKESRSSTGAGKLGVGERGMRLADQGEKTGADQGEKTVADQEKKLVVADQEKMIVAGECEQRPPAVGVQYETKGAHAANAFPDTDAQSHADGTSLGRKDEVKVCDQAVRAVEVEGEILEEEKNAKTGAVASTVAAFSNKEAQDSRADAVSRNDATQSSESAKQLLGASEISTKPPSASVTLTTHTQDSVPEKKGKGPEKLPLIGATTDQPESAVAEAEQSSTSSIGTVAGKVQVAAPADANTTDVLTVSAPTASVASAAAATASSEKGAVPEESRVEVVVDAVPETPVDAAQKIKAIHEHTEARPATPPPFAAGSVNAFVSGTSAHEDKQHELAAARVPQELQVVEHESGGKAPPAAERVDASGGNKDDCHATRMSEPEAVAEPQAEVEVREHSDLQINSLPVDQIGASATMAMQPVFQDEFDVAAATAVSPGGFCATSLMPDLLPDGPLVPDLLNDDQNDETKYLHELFSSVAAAPASVSSQSHDQYIPHPLAMASTTAGPATGSSGSTVISGQVEDVNMQPDNVATEVQPQAVAVDVQRIEDPNETCLATEKSKAPVEHVQENETRGSGAELSAPAQKVEDAAKGEDIKITVPELQSAKVEAYTIEVPAEEKNSDAAKADTTSRVAVGVEVEKPEGANYEAVSSKELKQDSIFVEAPKVREENATQHAEAIQFKADGLPEGPKKDASTKYDKAKAKGEQSSLEEREDQAESSGRQHQEVATASPSEMVGQDALAAQPAFPAHETGGASGAYAFKADKSSDDVSQQKDEVMKQNLLIRDDVELHPAEAQGKQAAPPPAVAGVEAITRAADAAPSEREGSLDINNKDGKKVVLPAVEEQKKSDELAAFPGASELENAMHKIETSCESGVEEINLKKDKEQTQPQAQDLPVRKSAVVDVVPGVAQDVPKDKEGSTSLRQRPASAKKKKKRRRRESAESQQATSENCRLSKLDDKAEHETKVEADQALGPRKKTKRATSADVMVHPSASLVIEGSAADKGPETAGLAPLLDARAGAPSASSGATAKPEQPDNAPGSSGDDNNNHSQKDMKQQSEDKASETGVDGRTAFASADTSKHPVLSSETSTFPFLTRQKAEPANVEGKNDSKTTQKRDAWEPPRSSSNFSQQHQPKYNASRQTSSAQECGHLSHSPRGARGANDRQLPAGRDRVRGGRHDSRQRSGRGAPGYLHNDHNIWMDAGDDRNRRDDRDRDRERDRPAPWETNRDRDRDDRRARNRDRNQDRPGARDATTRDRERQDCRHWDRDRYRSGDQRDFQQRGAGAGGDRGRNPQRGNDYNHGYRGDRERERQREERDRRERERTRERERGDRQPAPERNERLSSKWDQKPQSIVENKSKNSSCAASSSTAQQGVDNNVSSRQNSSKSHTKGVNVTEAGEEKGSSYRDKKVPPPEPQPPVTKIDPRFEYEKRAEQAEAEKARQKELLAAKEKNQKADEPQMKEKASKEKQKGGRSEDHDSGGQKKDRDEAKHEHRPKNRRSTAAQRDPPKRNKDDRSDGTAQGRETRREHGNKRSRDTIGAKDVEIVADKTTNRDRDRKEDNRNKETKPKPSRDRGDKRKTSKSDEAKGTKKNNKRPRSPNGRKEDVDASEKKEKKMKKTDARDRDDDVNDSREQKHKKSRDRNKIKNRDDKRDEDRDRHRNKKEERTGGDHRERDRRKTRGAARDSVVEVEAKTGDHGKNKSKKEAEASVPEAKKHHAAVGSEKQDRQQDGFIAANKERGEFRTKDTTATLDQNPGGSGASVSGSALCSPDLVDPNEKMEALDEVLASIDEIKLDEEPGTKKSGLDVSQQQDNASGSRRQEKGAEEKVGQTQRHRSRRKTDARKGKEQDLPRKDKVENVHKERRRRETTRTDENTRKL